MQGQYGQIILLTVLILGFLIIWAASIFAAYWDISRRDLPGREQLAWLALVSLLPFLGLFAYLFSRLIGTAFGGEPLAEAPAAKQGTLLKRPQGSERLGSTIPAMELISRTIPDANLYSARPAYENLPPIFSLEVIEGPETGRQFLLDNLPASIGRGPDVNIPLDEDHSISRRHAELYQQAGMLRIRDLMSTHGTQVNGYNISDKGLEPGDRVHLGASVLLVRLEEWR
jgi:hypothetical protein